MGVCLGKCLQHHSGQSRGRLGRLRGTHNCLVDVDRIGFGVFVCNNVARDFVANLEPLRNRRLAIMTRRSCDGAPSNATRLKNRLVILSSSLLSGHVVLALILHLGNDDCGRGRVGLLLRMRRLLVLLMAVLKPALLVLIVSQRTTVSGRGVRRGRGVRGRSLRGKGRGSWGSCRGRELSGDLVNQMRLRLWLLVLLLLLLHRRW